MDDNTARLLARQGYRVVGTHSGVKLCHWMRQKLLHGRVCYKERFYGISCHRCLQMTPAVDQCNLNCLFCWRVQNFSGFKIAQPDGPGDILDGCIEEHRRLTTGFKGDERCDPGLWREAQEPNQVAISLSGEPTFYPMLGELLEECGRRKMTTFLVTNGTTPKVLERLDPLPTQLYITLAAPDEDVYRKLCAPMSPMAWERLMDTLDLLPSLDTRKVIRLTLVDGWNMEKDEEYAKLILRARPDFVEAKGFVFVGSSRRRMRLENMPAHDRVVEFASRLSELTGYEVLDDKRDSRVALLGDGHRERMVRSGN